MVPRTTKNCLKLRSYFNSLNISTEKWFRSYGKPLRNFLSACPIVTSASSHLSRTLLANLRDVPCFEIQFD